MFLTLLSCSILVCLSSSLLPVTKTPDAPITTSTYDVPKSHTRHHPLFSGSLKSRRTFSPYLYNLDGKNRRLPLPEKIQQKIDAEKNIIEGKTGVSERNYINVDQIGNDFLNNKFRLTHPTQITSTTSDYSTSPTIKTLVPDVPPLLHKLIRDSNQTHPSKNVSKDIKSVPQVKTLVPDLLPLLHKLIRDSNQTHPSKNVSKDIKSVPQVKIPYDLDKYKDALPPFNRINDSHTNEKMYGGNRIYFPFGLFDHMSLPDHLYRLPYPNVTVDVPSTQQFTNKGTQLNSTTSAVIPNAKNETLNMANDVPPFLTNQEQNTGTTVSTNQISNSLNETVEIPAKLMSHIINMLTVSHNPMHVNQKKPMHDKLNKSTSDVKLVHNENTDTTPFYHYF